MDLFKPIKMNYCDRVRNLDIEAKGKVKSTKYFPVFLINGEEYIFKPLSKTKPLTTPLFAYSEVFWSYVINKYFDSNTPVYRLAYCDGVSDEQPKYYNKGVLVKSVLKDNQKLINLLEYFNKYPEKNVDISNYENYCMRLYDYTFILDSEFLKNNKSLGEGLSNQILLSILRQDQNFHYENINFNTENNEIKYITPPLDFEFSNMFLYPDNFDNNTLYKERYYDSLDMKLDADFDDDIITKFLFKDFILPKMNISINNIIKIIENYPNVVEDFIIKLELLLNEIDSINIHDYYNYIEPCNSESWNIGHYKYKENNEKLAKEYEEKYKPIVLNKDVVFENIKSNVKESIIKLLYLLKVYLYCYKNNVGDLSLYKFEYLSKIYENDCVLKKTLN